MATDGAADLDVMQLSDSAFPAGMFATSGGLEGLFSSGRLAGAAGLAEFAAACIELQAGPLDCVVLANAHRMCLAGDRAGVARADELCCAAKSVREAREASCRSGAQLAGCVAALRGSDPMLGWYLGRVRAGRCSGVYPASMAVCCAAMGIPGGRALLVALYGVASSAAGAALRLGMVNHVEAQEVIDGLKPLIARVAAESAATPLEDARQFAPELEVAQMAHEAMDARMFAT